MKRYPITATLLALALGTTAWGQSNGPRLKDSAVRPGELIVKFRETATEADKMEVHRKHGTKCVRSYRHFSFQQVKTKAGQPLQEAINQLQQDPAVEYAEPNYVVHSMVTPNDPQFSSLWGMTKIAAPAAWDTTTGSSSVVVAVIDSGIDYNHPDLKANMWVNTAEQGGTAGTDNDGNGYVDDIYGWNAVAKNGNPMDDNSHGTHVAGTIGGVGNNTTGVTGVNWNVKIMACKFLDSTGSGATSDAIACLDYIRTMKNRGVNIVATNNSWGGGGFSQALYDAISRQQDILFIAAAGNETNNNDATASYPANYDLPNIISVAATTSSDGLASFSNYGRRTVDVAAPGSSILSTVPGGGYGTKSGTSMATPHVTGLAALLKAKDQNLDWRGLRNLILSSGDAVSGLTSTTVTGRRINAFKGVTCLDSREFSVLTFPSTPQVGVPTTLSALSINCATAAGPVTVALSGGEVVTLHDDGVAPDKAAGDGIFAASFTPVRTPESFTFSSPAGTETVGTAPAAPAPVAVATTSLASGVIGKAYSQTLSATGGTTPYTWSILSGTLPAGLSLNAATGAITGTPTVTGTYAATFQVKDAKAATAAKALSIAIAAATTTPAPGADFIVPSVTGPTSAYRGTSKTFTVTVKNQGTSAAAASTLTLYVATDATGNTGYRLMDIAVGSLAAGGQASYTVTATIPWAPAGYYYLAAMADARKVVVETVETNNVKVGAKIYLY